MKRQENRKEILTYANIRRDLRRKLWVSWLLLIVCVVLSAGFIWSFHQFPELLFERGTGRYSYLPGWMMLLMIPFLLYVCIKEAWLVACGFRRKPYIAKDSLISSDGGGYYASTRWRTSSWGVLRFNGYGEYKVPDTNYPWSKEYPMTSEGVYHTSFDGDEFYLVLSKPHSGKILLAYPAKYFQLEGETPTEV